jgi:hypothetical protein
MSLEGANLFKYFVSSVLLRRGGGGGGGGFAKCLLQPFYPVAIEETVTLNTAEIMAKDAQIYVTVLI